MNLKNFFIVGLGFLLLSVACDCNAHVVPNINPEIQEVKKDEVVTLDLKGTRNTRDLGGYKTLEGKSLRCNLIFRSDNTDNLTDADIEKLKNDYNLKCVIDLRYSTEIASSPDRLSHIDGIDYYNVPLSISKEQMKNLIKGKIDLGDAYIQSLNQKDMVKKIFEIISSVEDGAILFHCTNGKDRTGTVATLLLGLNRVSKEDIVNNYSVTYELIKGSDSVRNGIKKYGTDAVFKSNPEYMAKLIEYIECNFGNVENYLLSCGISQQSLDKIKDRLQVP